MATTRTADIASLIIAVISVAAVIGAIAGGIWLIGLPLSWLLAPAAVVTAIIALIMRQRVWLCLTAIILAAGAIVFPLIFADSYIPEAVDAVGAVARDMI